MIKLNYTKESQVEASTSLFYYVCNYICHYPQVDSLTLEKKEKSLQEKNSRKKRTKKSPCIND